MTSSSSTTKLSSVGPGVPNPLRHIQPAQIKSTADTIKAPYAATVRVAQQARSDRMQITQDDVLRGLRREATFTGDGSSHAGTTLSVNDTDFGTQADNGMINNGLMIAEKASFISLSTVVGGTGTIEVDKGGVVYLRSQTSSGDVELRGGTLQFGGSNEFYAKITEITKGSMIELWGLRQITATWPRCN